MKTLITPAEVIEMAFEASEAFAERSVNQIVITAAERKFIKPVLNGLYDKLLEGIFEEFTNEYVKAPLALYVKWMLMPTLAVQSGNMGVVQISSGNFTAADRNDVSRARRRIKSDANALMRCAVEHIELNPARYPYYDERDNILNSTTMNGNIVL